MEPRKDHANHRAKKLVVCDYCEGSGLMIQFKHDDSELHSKCPKCHGEGRLLRTEIIQTRPITIKDKVFFRKVINS